MASGTETPLACNCAIFEIYSRLFLDFAFVFDLDIPDDLPERPTQCGLCRTTVKAAERPTVSSRSSNSSRTDSIGHSETEVPPDDLSSE